MRLRVFVSPLRSYRGIVGLKKSYHLRTKMVRDGKGDQVTDLHSVLGRWGNHFSQLLNVYGVIGVRQREI